jgi:hypothetical protein
MLTRPVVVAHTDLFLRQTATVWTEDEHEAFVNFIAMNADLGDVVPGLGGIRKIRWAREGMGKRGGTRVIYFFYDEGAPIYLLQVYAKGSKSDLSPKEKKTLQVAARTLKAEILRNRK